MFTAIGLMSGTSMDGVDAALLETNGECRVKRGAGMSFAYGAEDRVLLRQALADAAGLSDRRTRSGVLLQAQEMITQRHAEAVMQFLAAQKLSARDVNLLGFHGQTVLHRPAAQLTVQIGDGAGLAKACGIETVWDMRAADVAAGGQGAPLVPAYHRALFAASDLFGPVAIANIGGVANITCIETPSSEPLAFDTGPGNALIDDLMLERTGEAYDAGGAAGLAGAVDQTALGVLLSHPYFSKPFPKSLDRNAFSRDAVAHLSTQDAAATLAAFTAMSIALGLGRIEPRPRVLVVCGGGAQNAAIMENLRRMPLDVKTADQLGWSAEFMEAEAFAFLAVRAKRGLPLTFPMTTGVAQALTGGVISPP
ncbi:MAG: anhydro-N-acetylmuramic acid kinase [Alphaproteobacteria bacterium]|nr:anhydro-N-acetylmuramic acid kinase [Alphaproteobacteria bacterium]